MIVLDTNEDGLGGGPPTPAPEEALRIVKEHFAGREPPIGYLDGRTAMRDVLVEKTDCSQARAEALIDLLERHDQIRYAGVPTAPESVRQRWLID